jgi:nucleotide-binding universal stress UspA family protein
MNTPRWGSTHRSLLPRLDRVLCAVDVAQPTPGALGMAGLIAGRFSASLEALYVQADSADAQAPTAARLEALARSSGGSHATTWLAAGSPARTIVERASARDFDLIVLGSRSRSDLGWQFRNDVVRDVAALADCATLSVHERDTPAVIERILLPVDFGPATLLVTEWAAAFALCFGAKVQLLHVISRERSSERGVGGVELAAIERRLGVFGVDAGSQVIVAGSTPNGIESFNDQGEFDLVVMGHSAEPLRAPRTTRGVIASLRNRMSVPMLSVRATPFDATRPRARSMHHQMSMPERAASVEMSA